MFLAALAAAAATAAAPADYRNEANWLCRPGRQDACSPDPVRTVVGPDGAMRAEQVTRARRPRADCFYVYPTASRDLTPNSDLIPGIEEEGQAASQFAAFASVCRTFAPVYRQVTLTALHAAMTDSSKAAGAGALIRTHGDWTLAYEDVKGAWRDYLAHDNHGRPFILIGHSQGSLMLKRLVAEEIDGKPIAAKLVSAILPGVAVLTPKGRDRGGDFKTLPLCRADTQTGCILSWASYRDRPGPPSDALFGRSENPAMEAACTNPARLAGGAAALDAVIGFPWWIGGFVQYRQPQSGWSVSGRSLSTRFARIPGALSGQCVSAGGVSYLSVHVSPAPAGSLGAAMTTPAVVGDAAYPEWGWHVMDIPIVQNDLLRLVGRQIRAWRATGDGAPAGSP